MKILVVGGTGQVGSIVVQELLKRRADLRLLIRNERSSIPSGVEVAVGDLMDPPAVERAMTGVDKLYLLNTVSSGELTQGLIAYDLAKRHDLSHVVYHSAFRADALCDVPHFAAKLAIETAMRTFDVPWTIIRPNYFFQNDVRSREALRKGVYPTPLGDSGISAVDVRDIAEAAALALTTSGHEGKIYNLNGPDILSGAQAATIWSEVLSTPVRYERVDLLALEEMTRASGRPSWAAFDIRMMFQAYLERGFAAGPSDIETLTDLLGHAPRNYRSFAKETAAVWSSQST